MIATGSDMMTPFDSDLENIVKKPRNLISTTDTIDWDSVSVAISASALNYVTNAICSVQDDLLVLFMNRDLVSKGVLELCTSLIEYPSNRLYEGNLGSELVSCVSSIACSKEVWHQPPVPPRGKMNRPFCSKHIADDYSLNN
jgi:hypothetical protein